MASQRSAEEVAAAWKAKRDARKLHCSKGTREPSPSLISFEDWMDGMYYSKANDLIPKMLELRWNATFNYYYPTDEGITFVDCYVPDDDADVVIDPLTIDEVLRHEIVPALIAGGHIRPLPVRVEERFWRPWIKKLVEMLSMPLSKMPPQVTQCIRGLDFYISFLERLNALRLRKNMPIKEHPLQRSSSSRGSASERELVSSSLAMGGGGDESSRMTRARALPVAVRRGSRDRESGGEGAGGMVINLCDEESDAEDNQRTDPAPQPRAASLKAPPPRRQDDTLPTVASQTDTRVSGSSGGGGGGGGAKAEAKRAAPARPSSTGKTPARGTSQGQASGGGGAGEEGKARSSAQPSTSSTSSPPASQGRKRTSQGGAAAEPAAKQPRGAPASSSHQGGSSAPQHQRGESSRQQQGGGGGEVAVAAPVGAPVVSVADAVAQMSKHILRTLYPGNRQAEWNQEDRKAVRSRVLKAFTHQHDLVRGILEDVYGDGSRGIEEAAADALTSLASLAEFNAI